MDQSSHERVEADLQPLQQPRVILTTRGITDEVADGFGAALIEAAGDEQPRVALLITATLAPCSRCPSHTDPGEEVARKGREVIDKSTAQLASRFGALVEVIDAAADPVEQLEAVLRRSHCIYVTGGNTFYLMYHMRQSGLDVLVRQRVLNEGAIFVGCSAGSIVAGRSITTAFWKGWDDPYVVPYVWTEPDAVAGLGLVDVSLFPHYNASLHQELVEHRQHELDHDVVTLAETGGAYMVGPRSTSRSILHDAQSARI